MAVSLEKLRSLERAAGFAMVASDELFAAQQPQAETPTPQTGKTAAASAQNRAPGGWSSSLSTTRRTSANTSAKTEAQSWREWMSLGWRAPA
jgi:hypothetical protein